MKKIRKYGSLLLTAALCLSLLTVGALASEDPTAEESAEVQDILEMTEAAEEEPMAAAETPAEAEVPAAEEPSEEPAEAEEEITEIEASGEITETASEEAAMAATASGTCGDNVTWTLEDGTLTVSGTGEMEIEYEDHTTLRPIIPWASYCESITAVVIKSGVTVIRLQAFNGCENLTKITIPDSVTDIYFYGCSGLPSLTAFDAAAGNGAYTSTDGVLYNKDKTRLLMYPVGKVGSSFTIPDGVTYIEDYAFAGCTNLASVTIPGGVTYIGPGAFEGCTGLTSITIPDGVTRIQSATFSGCTSLAYVTFEGSVTAIGNDAFAGTPWLAAQGDFLIVNHDLVEYLGAGGDVTIPNDVTRILSYAFQNCTSLTSVTIPNSVANIQEYAFAGCTNLAEVSLPDSVIIDGIHAFGSTYGYGYAPWLTEQEEKQGDFLILGASLLAYRGSGGAVVIPDNVMSIGYDAFEDCAGLTSVTIPSSVKSIRGGAFANCTGLTSVTVPDSVTDLGWNVFNGCTGLVSAKLPSGLTEIPAGTFCGCTSLRDVTIPGGVTEIGIGAFEGCASLTGVTLPNGLTSIDGGAFGDCTSVTKIKIPASVTDISYQAFMDCTSLTAIAFDGDAPSVPVYIYGDEIKPFAGVTADATYYENTDGWTEDAKAAFGGNITWTALTSDSKLAPSDSKAGAFRYEGAGVFRLQGVSSFTNILVDGKPLDPETDYLIIDDEDLVVRLSDAYLAALADGNHTMTFVLESGGKVETSFTTGTSGTQTGGDNQSGGSTQTGGTSGGGTGTKTDAPSTGDETRIALWAVLALICAGGVTVTLAAGKKES